MDRLRTLDALSGAEVRLLACVCRLARAEAPTSGADVNDCYACAVGEPLAKSALYPALDGLADAGLIEKGISAGRANAYRPTRRGRQLLVAIHAWLGECLDGGES